MTSGDRPLVASVTTRGALLPAAALRGPTGKLHRAAVKPSDNTMVNMGLPTVEVGVDDTGTVVLSGKWMAWLAFGSARLVREDIATVVYAEAPSGDRLQTIGGLAVVSVSAGLFLLWGPKSRYEPLLASMARLGLPVSSDPYEWRRLQLGTFDLIVRK
jgi:hypothetical protein